jgi:hypothetical protein
MKTWQANFQIAVDGADYFVAFGNEPDRKY